jgi:tripartite-type tricarboxylate transporter receptor subunit TctC
MHELAPPPISSTGNKRGRAFRRIACLRGAGLPFARHHVVVPFPPGGSTDVAGRILADRMAAVLGQPVIIENVGGAGGSIGVGRVARATPDGYTIDIGQWDTHVAAIIYNPNYDLQTAFAPIGLISINPQLLVARKAFPADGLKSLVTWMKAHPGEAKFVNQVAAAQVGGLLLEKLTGTKMLFVPYRGAGPAMTDLISGQVDLMLAQATVMMPQVRAGTIKALVNLSRQRSPSIADIPASDEAGLPGLYLSGWFGLFAPRATPSDIIARLNSAMVEALAQTTVQKRFSELGLDIAAREQQTPEGLAAFHRRELEATEDCQALFCHSGARAQRGHPESSSHQRVLLDSGFDASHCPMTRDATRHSILSIPALVMMSRYFSISAR